MKKESFFETAFALRTVDRFLSHVALRPEISNYEQYQNLVRNESHPLSAALTSLVRCHGRYRDYNSFNRQTRYSATDRKGRMSAVIDHIDDSPREMVTISSRSRLIPLLGARVKQFVTFDQGIDKIQDVAYSDDLFGEHHFIRLEESHEPVQLTRFVQIAAPLIERFADSVR